MKPSDVISLLGDDLIPRSSTERARLDEIDQWLTHANPAEQLWRVTTKMDAEKRMLSALSHTPILRLVVEETAQQMILDGVSSTERDTTEMWRPWERNGMPSRQGALFAAAIGYGLAYTTVLPGQVPGQSGTSAVIKALSPRHLFVVYGDVVDDEYPMYALRTIPQGGQSAHFRLMDEESVHYVARDESGALKYIEERSHDVGVCPVVRWANGLDLEGRTPGEVDKHKTVARRMGKTTFDRLLIQHHNSWRVKTATGLEEPGTTEEKDRQKALLRQEDILTGGEGVSFGSLPETTMDSILKAFDTDRDTLAAMAQVPVWALNGGQLVNLSADALVEARSTARLKVQDKQRGMGRSGAQTLRLSAHIEGRAEDAADFGLTMLWADVESRSMSQAADALGKIATQLQVPVELMWEMIPGVSKTKADEWLRYAASHPSAEMIQALALAGQMTPTVDNGSDS